MDNHPIGLKAVQDSVIYNGVEFSKVGSPMKANLHPNSSRRSCKVCEVQTDNVRPKLVVGKQKLMTKNGENLPGFSQGVQTLPDTRNHQKTRDEVLVAGPCQPPHLREAVVCVVAEELAISPCLQPLTKSPIQFPL